MTSAFFLLPETMKNRRVIYSDQGLAGWRLQSQDDFCCYHILVFGINSTGLPDLRTLMCVNMSKTSVWASLSCQYLPSTCYNYTVESLLYLLVWFGRHRVIYTLSAESLFNLVWLFLHLWILFEMPWLTLMLLTRSFVKLELPVLYLMILHNFFRIMSCIYIYIYQPSYFMLIFFVDTGHPRN